MTEYTRARTILGIVSLVLAIPFSGLECQEQQGLRLHELISLARERSPRVRAAREQVEATRAREPGAGLLPDPALMVGVMNLALPEFSATMPASMAPTIQAMQSFPIGGKLSLREEIARQSTEIDLAASEEVWWEVRTEVAMAFYRIYEVDRQIEVMEETLGLLQNFETIARSMYGAGTGRQADVLRANVEVARMEAEIQRMTAARVGSSVPAERPPGPAGRHAGSALLPWIPCLRISPVTPRSGNGPRRAAPSWQSCGRSWNGPALKGLWPERTSGRT